MKPRPGSVGRCKPTPTVAGPTGAYFSDIDASVTSRTGRPVGQVPNDEQAAVVRRVFAEYNAGSSRQDIANGLNAEGIKTGTDKDWSHAASVTFYATSPMPGGASITAKISPRQIGIR